MKIVMRILAWMLLHFAVDSLVEEKRSVIKKERHSTLDYLIYLRQDRVGEPSGSSRQKQGTTYIKLGLSFTLSRLRLR